MSTSIFWEPAAREQTRVPGGSTHAQVIERHFGPMPVVLEPAHLPILDAMTDLEPAGPWGVFAEAIRRCESIRVTSNWT